MSFQPSITHHGIEQAVHALGYRNESALKYRLVAAIKGMYGNNGEFTEPALGIDSEELIRILWDVDPDPDSLRSKKKNLSSIKSSINADFKRLYREGKNPEGIMIGPENLFTISDEAKDDLLASIRDKATAAAEIRKIVGILSAILSEGGLEGESPREEMGSDFQQVRSLLRRLAEKMGLSGDLVDTVEEETERDQTGQEESPGNPDENGTDESESPLLAEPLGEGEGEFPDANPGDLVNDEEETSQGADIVDDADLTEVSEGEVYETLEEIEEEEELEVVDDTEPFDEDMEFCSPETVVDDDLMDEVDEITGEDGIGSEPEFAGEPDAAVEPIEIQEDVLVLEEDSPEAYDIDEEGTESEAEEEPSEGLEEIPAENGEDGFETLEIEGDPGDIEEEQAAEEYDDDETVVADDIAMEEDAGEGEMLPGMEEPPEEGDGVQLEEDPSEIEEEEAAEEYEDVVLVDDMGEEAPIEGDSSESSQDEHLESAPVQELSVGDESGGTEETEKEDDRVLSEKFNSSLSEMDRLYNQYLLITAGEYTIGSTNPKEKWNPARRVRLAEFYIGKFPVTNALFDVFVEKTGYRTTAERVGYGTVYYGRLQKRLDEKTGRETVIWNSSLTSKIVQGAFWYQPLGPGSNLHHKRNHPVVQISLEDAMAFASWTGKRLPTEEEWEAATRTMKGAPYPWGNKFRKDACNVEKSGYGVTTSVDRYMEFENEYGIADAMGNVMEWTTGRFESKEETDRGTVSFIAKGGSWTTSKPMNLASRTDFGPEFHSNNLGFRCVAN